MRHSSIIYGVVSEVAWVVVAVVAVQSIDGGTVFGLHSAKSVKRNKSHVVNATHGELEVEQADVLLETCDGRCLWHE